MMKISWHFSTAGDSVVLYMGVVTGSTDEFTLGPEVTAVEFDNAGDVVLTKRVISNGSVAIAMVSVDNKNNLNLLSLNPI